MEGLTQNIDEEILRQSTLSSFKKVDSNFYMLNYQNNYYLDVLLDKGVSTQNEVKNFASKKFGINFNFNILKKTNKSDSCSSFNVYNNIKENLLGRNFDYPKLSPTLVVWTQPLNGYKSISFVNGEYIGIFDDQEIVKERLFYSVYDIIDGCNEKGLALSILRLKDTPPVHQNDPTKKNVVSSIMMKGALDYCKNVKEAIRFFNKYNMQEISEDSSIHYLFSDSQGDSIIIEYIDNKMIVIKPYEIENSKYLFATNFFLSKPIGKENENGLDRYTILKDKLKDNSIMEINEAMNLLKEVHKNSTIWSNVYNMNKLTVITALRQEYNTLYEFKILVPNEYKIINDSNESK
jgi:hypothetical protein